MAATRKKQTRRGKRSYRKQYPVHGKLKRGKNITHLLVNTHGKPEPRTSRTEFTDGRHEGVGGMAKRAMECMRVSGSKYMGLVTALKK